MAAWLGQDGCLIMGVMNITPDSFSDGGKLSSIDAAINHAEQLIHEGVDILDVGGESTRPGAKPVSLQQEIDRVIPVVEAIKSRFDVLVSVDTSKAMVMQSAVDAGVDMLNDVSALADPQSLSVIAKAKIPICIMHMQGQPRTMQTDPQYTDVVQDVASFLAEKAKTCIEAGVRSEHIVIDPGLGFGKNLQHNLMLLAAVPEFCALGYAVLIGGSRKSMIDHLLGREISERVPASIALAAQAALNGAKIVRVHDVKQTYDAVRMVEAVAQYQ